MNEHIVKAYDEELKTLHTLIHQMGKLTLEQTQKAIQSILERKGSLAREVISNDYKINFLEAKINDLSMRVLALRQPVASDLRMVIAALKISNQVERIADYACNIAKRTLLLNELSPFSPVKDLLGLIEIPQRMLERSLIAFATCDVNLALHIWQMDREVDELYNTYLRQLFDVMIADPKSIVPCTHLLFVAKNIERIGDQATNIAEVVYTMVTGKPFKESEPLKNVVEL